MSLIESFIAEVTSYLIPSGKTNKNVQKLITFYDTSGYDFSFPVSLKIWQNYSPELKESEINQCEDNILVFSRGGSVENCLRQLEKDSATWIFTIETAVFERDRIYFNLQRSSAFRRALSAISSDSYGRSAKINEKTICFKIDDPASPSITQFRVELIGKTAEKLLDYSKFTIVPEPSDAKYKVLATSKSKLPADHPNSDWKLLTCGVVMNAKDRKPSELTREQFIKQRCEDMHLMSIHKYGIRMENDENFKSLVEKLGNYAAILDLLEVRPASALALKFDVKQAFILYNSARMETLMKNFEDQVTEGYYEELPEADAVDLSLLKEEEEWQLLKMLLIFPDTIERSINEIHQGKVSLHLIHKFLSNLVNVFSIYYRRVRVLTENRPHMQQVLFAKIHFLRNVRKILNESLGIIGILPLEMM